MTVRKTMTVIDALGRFPGSVVFIDRDTYFLRPSGELFDIGPARSRLHIVEAGLLESRTATDRAISDVVAHHQFRDLNGRVLDISLTRQCGTPVFSACTLRMPV
jgi:hypothetical protein